VIEKYSSILETMYDSIAEDVRKEEDFFLAQQLPARYTETHTLLK